MDQPVTFPDTETYYVVWLGGTSGAFISMCLYNMTTKETEIVLSEHGNAHINQKLINNNYLITNEGSGKIYNCVSPKFKNVPLIFVDHEPIIEFDKLFTRYPKCKVIIVHVHDKMIERLLGNMYYKNWCDLDYVSGSSGMWGKIRAREMSEYDDPKDVPMELVKNFLQKMASVYIKDNKDPFFFSKGNLPEEYKNSIFYIDFYDIIHNMHKVLSQLSDITGRPVSKFLEEQALNYQLKQVELVNSKLPWIDDK
jgi:hypothetical protein